MFALTADVGICEYRVSGRAVVVVRVDAWLWSRTTMEICGCAHHLGLLWMSGRVDVLDLQRRVPAVQQLLGIPAHHADRAGELDVRPP